jgi:hypothetical protein
MPTRSFRLNTGIRMLMAPVCIFLALVGANVAAALPGTTVASAAAPRVASAWSASLPQGALVHPARCDQAPPQSVKDRATYSPAELARYGLPPRSPGEPFAKWAKIVRTATTRYCDYTIGTGPAFSEFKSDIWAGNVDDQSSGAVKYTETDMDYIMPGTGTAANALYGAWIGLGGGENAYYTGSRVLVQTGTYAWTDSSGVSHFNAFWENTGASNSGANVFTGFTVRPNTKYYVKVWNGTCTYIQNVSTGANAGNGCAGGVNADGQTAEAIVERSYAYGAKYLADFGSVTFDGVGVTGNGTYKGIGKFGHYYAQIYQCRLNSLGDCHRNPDGSLYSPLELLASVGPISDDLNDYPYYGVKYTVTWKDFGW